MNNKEYLEKCLDSIYKNLSGRLKVKVVVVINSSTDGTLEMVKERYKSSSIIFLEKRLGFAQCHNLAFSENSDGRYFLILNDDTEVIGESIEKMVDCLERDKKIGALGCRILTPQNAQQPSFGSYPSLYGLFFELCSILGILHKSRIFSHFNGLKENFSKSKELIDKALWGCCFMVSREAVEKVGFIDETYSPAYLEETDWCLRIRKAGFKIYYLAQATIIHHHGKTMEKIDDELRKEVTISLQKNRYYFFRTHSGIHQEIVARIFDFVKNLVFCAYLLAKAIFNINKREIRSDCWFYLGLLSVSFVGVPRHGGKILTLDRCLAPGSIEKDLR